MNKIFKIFAVLITIIIAVFVIIYIKHPIISGWITGTVRTMSKPVNADVYTNGQINKDIKVYHDTVYWKGEKINNYLISLKEFDKEGLLEFINIDVDGKWIGRPVGFGSDCYDFINGTLFQSEVGSHFVDFKDDMKGFNFDPKLTFTNKEIKFNVPPHELKFDSVRIELNDK
jgi:hypothetical protein